MIRQDAERILELNRQIKELEVEMARIAAKSTIACRLASIPGEPRNCCLARCRYRDLRVRKIGSAPS